jgi:hypothetical protein
MTHVVPLKYINLIIIIIFNLSKRISRSAVLGAQKIKVMMTGERLQTN